MKYLVVFDTNVIVSALISPSDDSTERKLINYIQDKTIIPLFSEEILEEYKEVLKRPKFGIRKHLIALFISSIRKFGINIKPKKLKVDMKDISDIKFYEVVMDKRDNDAKLVTGNIKDFPKEKFIVKPKELLDIIENK